MDLLSMQWTLNHLAGHNKASVALSPYPAREREAFLRHIHNIRRSGNFSHSRYRVSLRSFLPLDDVEFHLVTLLQALVSIELNRAVVNKHVRAVIPTNKPITLCVIEPLDLPFILSH